ncbi:phosphopantothenoylcysteine decarboxylase [Plasmodium cynomolgi strain B]|uniref:Phosphopantothenoylcysteine decarboxylase n=1 Tax=Plasmodium cynomolgi (strain B) TaxID=1120755 RepID=K6UT56_PLACD|nr:phosphopantothenoylcysteine decarboxylase [Plasmodium cynomolgi strain B]GAB65240.1 phosphopantothenoylcysteine decarboxylase [Plasmodium cynomolgi strain B]
MNLLIGVSASIAAIKLGEVKERLKERCRESNLQVEIKYVATTLAYDTFLKKVDFCEEVLLDRDEWTWEKMGDEILHVELRKWADLFVICPMDANTLASVASGACPNLLTCICRCWDFRKPLLVFPCMNTYMYDHPITREQLKRITSWGVKVVEPVEKLLACGDYGIGALPPVEDVVEKIVQYIKRHQLEVAKKEINTT